ncbi:MAG: aconitate hydratase, partial [Candidatus Nanoarchaeia archaeon]
MPTLSEKILKRQLANGKFEKGEPITIKLDQCLLQDATGTVAWLEFEAMGGKCIRPLTVQYIDHNLLQTDNKNMDDHLFLENIATRFGAHVSQPGNGISHHVHKERFTKPGRTMIGSDSHTPTSGGAGMIAIGTGGLDVAIGMATGEYQVRMPEIVGVKLTGKLKPWSTAKDVILEVLRRIGVDGGKGKILEYFGPGVKTLSLSERSTICNMGAETGATTSIFPTDERTKSFFKAQQRLKDYKPLSADKDAEYDDIIEMDLGTIEPLIACPYSPGNVKPIREVAGKEVYQAMIGSSTNSSYEEMMRAAHMIDSKGPHHRTAFHVIPGSRQLLQTMARDSGLLKLLKAKARFAEPSCNACIGMGNAPGTNMISVRSFPRNWKGRSGTACDKVYLSSVETATACAIKGEITDPRDLKLKFPIIKEPKSYVIDDSMIRKPHKHPKVRRGPNITRMEYRKSIDHAMKGKVVIKVGDDVS